MSGYDRGVTEGDGMNGLRGHWQVEGDLPPEAAIAATDAVMEAEAQGKSLIVVEGVTLRWVPAPGSLDAAWAEAEAALPKGTWLRVEHDPSISDVATSAEAFEYGDVDAESPIAHVDAESPAAALRALAARLREVGR